MEPLLKKIHASATECLARQATRNRAHPVSSWQQVLLLIFPSVRIFSVNCYLRHNPFLILQVKNQIAYYPFHPWKIWITISFLEKYLICHTQNVHISIFVSHIRCPIFIFRNKFISSLKHLTTFHLSTLLLKIISPKTLCHSRICTS